MDDRPEAKRLLELLLSPTGSNEDLTSVFRERFLSHASETEENRQAIRQISYGLTFDPSVLSYGLRVGDAGVSLSDISHGLEELDCPQEMTDLVPGLTPEAWEAGLRIITVILASLENRMLDKPKPNE